MDEGQARGLFGQLFAEGGRDRTNFKLNVKNYLGLENQAFRNKMMQIALTNPTAFYKLRDKTLETVIDNMVSQLYDHMYNLLTTGTDLNGASVITGTNIQTLVPGWNDAQFRPAIPAQKVSEFALKASKTLEEIVREAVDLILPEDYIDLAKARLARKSDGRNIDL